MKIRYTLWHYINRRVSIDGHNISLSPNENSLLFVLYVNMGRSVAPDVIFEALWGDHEDGGPLYWQTILGMLLIRLREKTGLNLKRQAYFGVRMFEPVAGAAE